MEIFEAVAKGERSVIESLLAANPELVLSRNASGIRPVMLAVYYGQAEIAEFLRSQMESINFWEAAALGEILVLQGMLSEDSSWLDAFSPDGFSALGLATFFSQHAVQEWLLGQGADPNLAAQNSMAVRPIHSAAAIRNPADALASVRLLVAYGAQVNVSQQGGWTPLHQAADHGNQPLVEFLLQVGADRTAKSSDGRTPAEMAAEKGFNELAVLLR